MEGVHFVENWTKDLHVLQEAADNIVDMDCLNRNTPGSGRQTHQGLQRTPLDVIETGKSLRFQTEHPHLVSLGSGRLSTAITLLPLPEGRTTVGHSPMDINIQGPGVAAQHCYIENRSGVIMLHPCGNLCAVDGLQVSKPVRLSQGSGKNKNLEVKWLEQPTYLKVVVSEEFTGLTETRRRLHQS